jgi:hypothetical protein
VFFISGSCHDGNYHDNGISNRSSGMAVMETEAVAVAAAAAETWLWAVET